jgi:ankyrin repeat protein
MPLSDLPREIVLDIVDQLNDAGMNALAHTNSQMYQLLNKYLYRRDITDVTRASSRSLTWAIENGVEPTIQRAVDAARHLDPIPWRFYVALEIAAFRGDVNIIAALLKLDGIDPNFGISSYPDYPNFGFSLIWAAERGHSAVVELLLTVKNINPNIGEQMGPGAPLLRACWGRHASVVRQLLARDEINVNTVGSSGTETPLIAAIRTGNMEIINLLLSNDGIDVNFHPQSISAPLMVAIESGLMEVVESLLARDDLDLNIVDDSGDHLLLHSMRLGLDKVKLILDRTNADPNIVGFDGRTALMMACSMDKEDLELIEFLLDQGIDVNRRDADGMTALCYAIRDDRSKVIKFLLDRDDIDPNLPDIDGYTPLFHAVMEGTLSVAGLLLRKKCIDVNARNNDGFTALAIACTARWLEYHDPNFVHLLLHTTIQILISWITMALAFSPKL